MPEVILSFHDVHKDYLSHSSEWWSKSPLIKAVQGFDLDVEEGDSWGVVGESGCGKSTLAKMVMGLEKPTQGKIHFQSHELLNISAKTGQASTEVCRWSISIRLRL